MQGEKCSTLSMEMLKQSANLIKKNILCTLYLSKNAFFIHMVSSIYFFWNISTTVAATLKQTYYVVYVLFSFLFHQTELSPAPKRIVEKKPEDKLFDLVPMNRFDAEEMEKMERRKKMSPTSKGNGFLSNM